ncbi:hypothetical protein [Legionella spiritensis]|uniref:Uncharacterized protein n=1 Tax=Legionella spiritensis TaxID=452 RepID=A0A0W0Z591_LEGSP|nr:hypothetical protein [Legionella spiritensis]KTD64269.1 hypothetical protein Lspi_1076 [Legionella spiritensis]SNV47010.1 Uncharacterised protein [Legionella spiritensis]
MTHHIPDEDYSSGSNFDYSSYRDRHRVVTQTPEQKLLNDLQEQLDSVKNKSGTKHEHKTNVLQTAINVLQGKETPEDLVQAKQDNPRYNEALFSSKTEKLVDKVLEMMPPTSGHRLK